MFSELHLLGMPSGITRSPLLNCVFFMLKGWEKRANSTIYNIYNGLTLGRCWGDLSYDDVTAL